MFKLYYSLVKPGIIYGNLLTTIAGFLFASHWHIHTGLFLATIIGTSFVIGSGCVYNNYIDRSIDKHMARTKKRALVSGQISGRQALVFATVLGVFGFAMLALFTNAVVVAIGAIGFLDYVILYGITKRHGAYGTIVGSISGATPVVAGYCAVTGRVDTTAWILFLILVLWQMPHFYAIAMYRAKDYAAAGLPVLPVKQGVRTAKIHIVGYVAAFIVSLALLTVYGHAGYIFLGVMGALGLVWLWKGLGGFKAIDDAAWARSMFLFSLIIITALSVMLAVGSVLA